MAPLSASQVLTLAREAMRAAHENEAKAAQASGVSDNLKPGLTIDLSRKRIETLPEEIVDIIKDELERYAFSKLLGLVCGTDESDSTDWPFRTTSCNHSLRDFQSALRSAISMSDRTGLRTFPCR